MADVPLSGLLLEQLPWLPAAAGSLFVPMAMAAPTTAAAVACSAMAALGVAGTAALQQALPLPVLAPYTRLKGNGRHRVTQPYHVGLRRLPPAADGTPGLYVYYPTDVAPHEGTLLHWLPGWGAAHPRGGDMRYAFGLYDCVGAPRFAAWLQRRMRLDGVVENAPVAPAVTELAAAGRLGRVKEAPVMLLSHGLMGHATMYSSLAMDLAARGAIVVAMEHADGSGCFAQRHPDATWELPRSGAAAPAHVDAAVYAQKPRDELVPVPYEAPGDGDVFPFRRAQLDFRMRELRATAAFIGRGELNKRLSLAPLQASAEDPIPVPLVGHSFGGLTAAAGVLRQRLGAASAKGGAPVVMSDDSVDRLAPDAAAAAAAAKVWHPRAVALDLWTEPHADSLPAEAAAAGERFEQARSGRRGPFPPLLMLDSENWERWTVNRVNEEALCEKWPGGKAERHVQMATDHQSAADAGLLRNFPGARKKYWGGLHADRWAMFQWAGRIWEDVTGPLPTSRPDGERH